MSNIENNVRKMPHTHPNEFTCFAIVVEGEVASYVTHPNTDELHIAIHRSAPIFIEVPYLERPPQGSVWDGTKFILEGQQ